ncbi:MAG: hypothetical protein WAM68_08590, partial [Acidobacteriaceae bacterium]
LANEKMAAVLAAKHYHYQFVFAKNAGHVDHATRLQTLPEALEYLWQGYPKKGSQSILRTATSPSTAVPPHPHPRE